MTRAATDLQVTIIQPPGRWPGLGLTELWRTRSILLVLARRLLLVRYRQAALGFAWVIIQPLVLTVIISVFLGLILGRGAGFGMPYPVFLFAAWVVWRAFLRIVTDGGGSLARNGSLVQRIYLPRAFFPLSVAAATFVDWVALAVALVIMGLVYGITPGLGLLALPILLAIMYAAALGVAFFFAAASLRYGDVDFVMPLITQAWFWSSPIVYPSAVIPEPWRIFYYLNPMAVVIEGTRWAFTRAPSPPPEAWILGILTAGAMLVFGYLYFRRNEPMLADLL